MISYPVLNRRDSITPFKNPASGALRFTSSKPFKQGGYWSTRKDRHPGFLSLQVVRIVPVLSFFLKKKVNKCLCKWQNLFTNLHSLGKVIGKVVTASLSQSFSWLQWPTQKNQRSMHAGTDCFKITGKQATEHQDVYI